jgi:hypothetical protein
MSFKFFTLSEFHIGALRFCKPLKAGGFATGSEGTFNILDVKTSHLGQYIKVI